MNTKLCKFPQRKPIVRQNQCYFKRGAHIPPKFWANFTPPQVKAMDSVQQPTVHAKKKTKNMPPTKNQHLVLMISYFVLIAARKDITTKPTIGHMGGLRIILIPMFWLNLMEELLLCSHLHKIKLHLHLRR